jgi:hypothetical protein
VWKFVWLLFKHKDSNFMGFRWGDSSLVIAIFYAPIRFAVLRTTALYKQEAM